MATNKKEFLGYNLKKLTKDCYFILLNTHKKILFFQKSYIRLFKMVHFIHIQMRM